MKHLKLHNILHAIISATFFPRKEVVRFYNEYSLQMQPVAKHIQH